MATQVAREGFAFTGKDGLPRVFSAGQLVDDTDPDFKGREHLFQPADQATAQAADRRGKRPTAATETASAAPGEMRTRSHPLPTPADLPKKPPVVEAPPAK